MEEEEHPSEQTLKKLLVKICMRAEVERFRAQPTCWRDGEANPLLYRSLCALRTCPLLHDAGLVTDADDAFQQCLSALPQLAAKLKAIEGGDLLITLANDLGNFWQLMLVTEDEERGAEPSDMALFDDLCPEDQNGATARALREQSMRSFKVALSDIGRMSGGFDEAYHMITGTASVEEVAPPSVQLAIVHAFDAMDYAITRAVLTDDVRRKDFKRKAKQLSNPLLGPLLNAANPFRLLPTFARFAIRMGIAERLALRGARQKLSEAQRAVPNAVAVLILEHVEQGKANMPVAQLKAAHVQHIVGCEQEDEEKESALLHMLKHAALVWQKRQMMQLMRRAEFAFLLDHIIPMLGTPLAALYGELRIGDEIRNIGVLLQNVARRYPQALPNLRARLFAYITATLRHPGSHQLRQLLSWLFENLSQPQTISLRALVAQHAQGHAAALWAEVDEARARLLRGEHFQDLALPLVRLLAPHFHATLRVDAP